MKTYETFLFLYIVFAGLFLIVGSIYIHYQQKDYCFRNGEYFEDEQGDGHKLEYRWIESCGYFESKDGINYWISK